MTRLVRHPAVQPVAAPLPMHLPTPQRDRMRTCRYCRWVEVRRRFGSQEDSLSCTSKWGVRGRAGEGLSCCDFEREPGSDDGG